MNWDMLGHEWAVDLLKHYITQDKVRHAYLFSGPPGVGRRTLALRFSQALNCPQPLSPGEPCRECRACRLIERMQHPDLAVVEAEYSEGTLKVDQIRALQRSLSLAPYEARYRIALLLRFEEANANAANALLKTLEDPPRQVILLLTAESSERLLPTITSRCEVIRLRPLPVEATSQALQARWEVDPEQAGLLAHLSAGRPGYALKLLHEPEKLRQRQEWLDEHAHLLGAGLVERFAYALPLTKDKERLRDALQVWLSYWRDVLLRAAGSGTDLVNQDRAEEIEALATKIELEAAYRVVASLERTSSLLDQNINSRLATEVLFMDLPRI